MCTVIAWSGKLPKGLLTQLLIHAESRGRDSTGVAYHTNGRVIVHRQCVPASKFVADHQDLIKDARLSPAGIAHARRASPGNPVNNDNAHPFAYFQYVFAHNGRITNVNDLCNKRISVLTAKQSLSEKERRQLSYFRSCTTDSMIIGPYIHDRDFTDLVGDMGLVWMVKDHVYCMRSCKELSCATLTWSSSDDTGVVTVAASTPAIINDAMSACNDIAFTSQFYIVEEHRIYNLTPTVLMDEGLVPVNPSNKHDDFSSGKIDSAEPPQDDNDEDSNGIDNNNTIEPPEDPLK